MGSGKSKSQNENLEQQQTQKEQTMDNEINQKSSRKRKIKVENQLNINRIQNKLSSQNEKQKNNINISKDQLDEQFLYDNQPAQANIDKNDKLFQNQITTKLNLNELPTICQQQSQLSTERSKRAISLQNNQNNINEHKDDPKLQNINNYHNKTINGQFQQSSHKNNLNQQITENFWNHNLIDFNIINSLNDYNNSVNQKNNNNDSSNKFRPQTPTKSRRSNLIQKRQNEGTSNSSFNKNSLYNDQNANNNNVIQNLVQQKEDEKLQSEQNVFTQHQFKDYKQNIQIENNNPSSLYQYSQTQQVSENFKHQIGARNQQIYGAKINNVNSNIQDHYYMQQNDIFKEIVQNENKYKQINKLIYNQRLQQTFLLKQEKQPLHQQPNNFINKQLQQELEKSQTKRPLNFRDKLEKLENDPSQKLLTQQNQEQDNFTIDISNKNKNLTNLYIQQAESSDQQVDQLQSSQFEFIQEESSSQFPNNSHVKNKNISYQIQFQNNLPPKQVKKRRIFNLQSPLSSIKRSSLGGSGNVKINQINDNTNNNVNSINSINIKSQQNNLNDHNHVDQSIQFTTQNQSINENNSSFLKKSPSDIEIRQNQNTKHIKQSLQQQNFTLHNQLNNDSCLQVQLNIEQNQNNSYICLEVKEKQIKIKHNNVNNILNNQNQKQKTIQKDLTCQNECKNQIPKVLQFEDQNNNSVKKENYLELENSIQNEGIEIQNCLFDIEKNHLQNKQKEVQIITREEKNNREEFKQSNIKIKDFNIKINNKKNNDYQQQQDPESVTLQEECEFFTTQVAKIKNMKNNQQKLLCKQINFNSPNRNNSKQEITLSDNYVFFDSQLKNTYEMRQYKNLDDFEYDVLQINNVEKSLGVEFLQDFSINQTYIDLENLSIYKRKGFITLNQLLQLRNINNVLWQDKEPEVIYMLDRLIKIVFKMHNQNVYLKNLNVHNIVFESDSSDRLHLKIIDLEKNSLDFKIIDCSDSENIQLMKEVNDVLQQQQVEEQIKFEDSFQRLRFEVFRIGKIIMKIILSNLIEQESEEEQQMAYQSCDFYSNLSADDAFSLIGQHYLKSTVKILKTILSLEYDQDFINVQLKNTKCKPINEKYIQILKFLEIEKIENQNQKKFEIREISSLSLESLVQELDICEKLKLYSRAEKIILQIEKLGIEDLIKNRQDFHIVIMGMAELYKIRCKFKKSEELQEIANKSIIQIFGENSEQQAKIYLEMGFLQKQRGNYQKSSQFYEQALQIFLDEASEKNLYYLVQCYKELASLQYEQHQLEQAEQNYLKCVDIYFMNQEFKEILNIFKSLANQFQQNGKIDKGLLYLKLCIELMQNLDNNKDYICEISDIYNNIAQIYEKQQQYEKSEQNYQKVLKLLNGEQQNGVNQVRIADIYQCLGRLYFMMNQPQLARQFYTKRSEILGEEKIEDQLFQF